MVTNNKTTHIELGNPSPEKFIDKWYELRQEYPTDELAWEAVERMHASIFECNRYSSYNSFRNARDKFNTKQRGK